MNDLCINYILFCPLYFLFLRNSHVVSIFRESKFIYQFLYQFNHPIFQLFLQKMNESRIRSPEQGMKKSQLMPSPNNSKSKAYLPSRYAQDRKPDKTGFHDILNSIETKTNNDILKFKCQNSPKLKQTQQKPEVTALERKTKTSQFKSRPLKRQKSDQINFNEIFLNPREEALEQLKKKSCLEDNIKTISKQYQKLLKFEDENQSKIENEQVKQIEGEKHNENYEQMFSMLQSGDAFGINIQTNQNDFYDNHISIEPPDVPTTTTNQASSSTSYAPSIPSNYKSYKNLNVKQLLMRARAGMNGEDVVKQAHLSYFLGEVYSDKKMFSEALKFHRRYLGFAKAMEDMIGMGLGANRVAISYFNCNEIEKSIIFHNQNLKLSNNDNCFVGFYNIGICYRKLKKLDEALEYFESALSWAQEKGEQESQCIALGQIGVTYQSMELYEQAISKFERSIQICEKIKKQDLKLHNLRYILRICSMLHLKPLEQLQRIVQQAFICAQQVQGRTMLDVFRCNIGIVKGVRQMNKQMAINQYMNEIQEI